MNSEKPKRSAATMEAMESLHQALATALANGVKDVHKVIPAKIVDDVVVEEERVEVIQPSPAMLAVAAKFLKDNSVFATDEQSGAVADIRNNIKQRAINRKPSAQDQHDALRSIGQGLLQ